MSEMETEKQVVTHQMTIGRAPCLICGEGVAVIRSTDGVRIPYVPGVCDACKEAVLYMRGQMWDDLFGY